MTAPQGQQWLTFLSDYGLEDVFLGVCKGVIARTAPQVRVLDVLHLVTPQDVEQGAAVLASAVPYLPAPAVHLALVDPFRAPPARGVAVRTADGSVFVSPDNGLTSLAWEVTGGAVAAHVVDNPELWHPSPARTFRGRDVFSPVAARLAAGLPLEQVGTPLDVDELERLEVRRPAVESDHVHGEVVQVDHFGISRSTSRARTSSRPGCRSATRSSCAATARRGSSRSSRPTARPAAAAWSSARTPSAPSPSPSTRAAPPPGCGPAAASRWCSAASPRPTRPPARCSSRPSRRRPSSADGGARPRP